MSKVYIDDSKLAGIGDAIRAMTGSAGRLLPSEMPQAIRSIELPWCTFESAAGASSYTVPKVSSAFDLGSLSWESEAIEGQEGE